MPPWAQPRPRCRRFSGSFLALIRPAQKVCRLVLHNSARKGEVAWRARAQRHSWSQCQADIPKVSIWVFHSGGGSWDRPSEGWKKITALYSLYKIQIQTLELRVLGLQGWAWLVTGARGMCFNPSLGTSQAGRVDRLTTEIPRSWTRVAQAFLGCWCSDLLYSSTPRVIQFLPAYLGD